MGVGAVKILIIGTNPNSLVLAQAFQKNPRYRFAGFLEVGTLSHDFPKKPIGTLPEFEKTIRREGIEEVVIASRKLTRPQTRDILEFCRTNHVDFRFVPDLLEVLRKNVDFETMKGLGTRFEAFFRLINQHSDSDHHSADLDYYFDRDQVQLSRTYLFC